MGKKREKDDLYQIIRNQNDMLNRIVTITENSNKVATGSTAKLIKPAKVPSWSKGMRIDSYKKSIEVWMENNKDLPQTIRYQEVLESIKLNKEIEGLAEYIGEHVIEKLDTLEKQTVKNLMDLLDIKFGRTRLEELEEMMEDWISFNFNEYESEEQYILAQEKLIARQEEKNITLKEWNTIWLMYGAKQRQGIQDHQLQELRSIVKRGGPEVQKQFIQRYRELKIEFNRDKGAACTNVKYLNSQSTARKRFDRIRRDSRGRDYYQDSKNRIDTRGRPFYRRYYKGDKDRKRSFSREMRAVSRNRSKSPLERQRSSSNRGRTRERSGSAARSKSCIRCKCEACDNMAKVAKELNVKWCEEFTLTEEILVNYTEKGKQVMIIDLGAPVSLAGEKWINQYLKDHELELKDLKSHKCHQRFRFGPSKQYISTMMVEIPVIVASLDGKENVLQVFTYIVDADIPFLCGKREITDIWKSTIDTGNKTLEVNIDGRLKKLRLITTSGNHMAIAIEKSNLKEEQIFFTEENEELNTFKAIKKVHEVTNHKSAEKLIKHYKTANLIGPNTIKTIKKVVQECKICQKFSKSMVKPKIALPVATSFNEIVTLDLKQFGDRYVLWCVDACTRFIQGKLLENKQAETIIDALNDCWNLPFGIPSVGYHADNGTEFKNIKMDELISKLGISISYGPAYSPWSNGINERNHASADATIKKLMKEKDIELDDTLIKTAAWTHNTNINKLGYSPLTLVTGKAVSIPGITMGNEGTESLTDAEVVSRILGTMQKVMREFREVEMRKKLKECQEIRTRSYQHLEKYIIGDKIWYQHQNGNAWFGPAEVIFQKGNSIFIYNNGDIKKVAMCRAKPYELKTKKNEQESPEVENRVQNEVEDEIELEEIQNETRKDLQNDVIGAKYLQVEKSVYFMDHEIFTVEVPVKEHKKPEIIEAKNTETENLRTYETFEDVEDIGQTTIGSRWIVTEKQKHDGQKQDYKARLVAKGFQELDQPQSDSPTAAKESFKLIMALSANFSFKMVSMDIRAAFLQAKALDREVFVRPPKDIENEGKIWKLLKPLYGLDDASRKFYLKVKETLQKMGLKTLPGDDAVYYEHKNGELIGLILSHVDDFTIAGIPEFVERIVAGIKGKFTVSKVEEDNFRFTGLDVKTKNDQIEISMEDLM